MSVAHPRQIDDAVFGVALAAGAANIVMQLARPAVGHGVVESPVDSGKATLHPVKRARTTFTYLAVALWGCEVERRAYRKAVDGSHAQVRSTPASPVPYSAFDPELQLWVAACLYRGLEDVHRALFPASSFRGEHGIYEAAQTLGTTLQVRPDQWPADRDAFERYWTEQLDRIAIDEPVRRYLTDLADLALMPWPVRKVFGPVNRFFTIGFLPPRFRDEMRFPWSEREQVRFDRIFRVLGRAQRVVPRAVRVFPYNACLADFRRGLRHGLPVV